MKRLNLYIVKSFLGTFVFTFVIVVFVLLMQFVWLWIDELVGKGLEMSILAQLFFYTSITFVPMALPLAILLASLMCFGNFGEHYELVAMKASGISMWKIMRPLMFFCIFLTFAAFFFSNSIVPIATLKMKTLLFDVKQQKLAFDLKEGVFYKDIENYVIYIKEKGSDGSSIYGVKIFDHTDKEGNTKIITADSGNMRLSPNKRNIIFTLYDGYNYTDITSDKSFKKRRPFERMQFKEQRLKFSLKDFDMTRTDEDLFKSHQAMLNMRQLSSSVDSLQRHYKGKQRSYNENFCRRYQNYNTMVEKESNAQMPLESAVEPQSLLVDSASVLQWPLMSCFEQSERINIIDMAVGAAKIAKENAVFNKNDFKARRENIKRHQKEWHKKLTLSLACIIFFFIGAPLGSIIRKGGLGFPTVISVVFFVIYWVTSTITERMAVTGGLNVFLGVWTSSLMLFPIGLFLTMKAATDAPLLDADSWRKLFKRIFSSPRKS